jgi:putative acetyltransferase
MNPDPLNPDPLAAHPAIRAVRDTDGPGLLALIADCFAAYPGCVFDIVEFPELQAPATTYSQRGGQLWVAEGPHGEIVGSIAATPATGPGLHPRTIELTKMYVAESHRGGRLARALVDRFLSFADAAGAVDLILWTDTRFERAHAFYRRLGFVQGEEVRELGDLSATSEYFFSRKAQSPDRSSEKSSGSASRAGDAVSFPSLLRGDRP